MDVNQNTVVKKIFDALKDHLADKFLFGRSDLLELVLISYLARGHVLIEGPPGTAKTMTSRLLASMLARSFKRIQFTSDMLPSDIIGANMYSPKTQELHFVRGPLFSDFVLADEINRTPPRTQSALLEAMEERQVTVEGTAHPLSPDFFVIATQNPQDYEGTFMLPEVQLDRFLMKLNVQHAGPDLETKMLQSFLNGALPPQYDRIPKLNFDRAHVDAEIASTKVEASLMEYIAQLLKATREHPLLMAGSSFRGGIALLNCSRIKALIQGRAFVTPDDIKALTPVVLQHRLRLSAEAQVSDVQIPQIIEEIMGQIPFPK